MIEFLVPVFNGYDLIRVGNPSDGGYLLPDDLKFLDSCLSIGCDSVWSFEKSLHFLTGTSSHILDEFDKKPHDLFSPHIYHSGLLGINNSPETITLKSFIEKCAFTTSTNLILQMDIEGAEYDILLDIEDDQLLKFRIIVIEFHDFKRVRAPEYLIEVVLPIFQKLANGFHLVHFHPNNCRGLFRFGKSFLPEVFEVTFHRKDRIKLLSKIERSLPHPFDYPNIVAKPDIVAIFRTYK